MKIVPKHRPILVIALIVLLWCGLLFYATPGEAVDNVLDPVLSGLKTEIEAPTVSSYAVLRSNNTVTGYQVTLQGTSSCGNTPGSSKTAALTFTNTSGERAILRFSIKIQLNSGTSYSDYTQPAFRVKIGETGYGNGARYYGVLDPGGSVRVDLSTPESATEFLFTLDGFSLTPSELSRVTLSVEGGGSVTVTGPEGSGYSRTVSGTEALDLESKDEYTLTADTSAVDLMGWRQDGAWLPGDRVIKTTFPADSALEAVFVPKGTPIFSVDGERFSDLDEATSYAAAGGIEQVLLASDGTLAGSHTIPGGVVLVIPRSDTVIDPYDDPASVYGVSVNRKTPTAFRTLTMAEGAQITVENGGAISVQSELMGDGTDAGSWIGTPNGPNGRIVMNSGSGITLNDGAKLYCFGYISGGGSVTAENGAEVWECFQLRGWRNLSILQGVAEEGIFPVNQYYVQNIEVPLTICYGANERVYSVVYVGDAKHKVDADYLGSAGMFRLTSEDSRIVKDYIEGEDRLEISLYGDAAFSSLSLSIPSLGRTISSASRSLPLTNNITVKICSGRTVLSQKVDLLPGAVIQVAKNAELSLNAALVLYDQDEWVNNNFAVYGEKFVPAGYSAANGSTAVRTVSDLADAKLDVNGRVYVHGNSTLYTTAGGADITSSQAGGYIIFSDGQAAANGETKQFEDRHGTDVSKQIVTMVTNPARLHNGTGYTSTVGTAAPKNAFTYDASKSQWVRTEPPAGDTPAYSVTITWGDLSYDYVPAYEWDTRELRYHELDGAWDRSSDHSVRVENAALSPGGVTVSYAFAPAEGLGWQPTLSFYRDGGFMTACTGADTLAAGQNETVYMRLDGEPDASFAAGTVGAVTVTVAPAD